MLGNFSDDGFALVPAVIATDECNRLTALAQASLSSSRCFLSNQWCLALAQTLQNHAQISPFVPANYVPVQCTYFAKTKERNWLVAMHQDLSIPVAERVNEASLGAWSEKDNMLFVQAPVEILQELIILRLHLDPCTVHDGPVRVVPGSHQFGRINQEAAMLARQAGEVNCLSEQGGVLVMRPLLLHASSKSTSKNPRRVLHFVFGPSLLPFGLRWSNMA